jgi:hypothetical protein
MERYWVIFVVNGIVLMPIYLAVIFSFLRFYKEAISINGEKYEILKKRIPRLQSALRFLIPFGIILFSIRVLLSLVNIVNALVHIFR